jgi:hypothetical protein
VALGDALGLPPVGRVGSAAPWAWQMSRTACSARPPCWVASVPRDFALLQTSATAVAARCRAAASAAALRWRASLSVRSILHHAAITAGGTAVPGAVVPVVVAAVPLAVVPVAAAAVLLAVVPVPAAPGAVAIATTQLGSTVARLRTAVWLSVGCWVDGAAAGAVGELEHALDSATARESTTTRVLALTEASSGCVLG